MIKEGDKIIIVRDVCENCIVNVVSCFDWPMPYSPCTILPRTSMALKHIVNGWLCRVCRTSDSPDIVQYCSSPDDTFFSFSNFNIISNLLNRQSNLLPHDHEGIVICPFYLDPLAIVFSPSKTFGNSDWMLVTCKNKSILKMSTFLEQRELEK